MIDTLTRKEFLAALSRIEDRANAECLEITDAANPEWVIAATMSQLCQELAAELAPQPEESST